MPTFPQWDETTLEHVYDDVDYLSLHIYARKIGEDTGTFLAESLAMDHQIETIIAACDLVKAKQRHSKTMLLAFDEWNVWYHAREADQVLMRENPWQIAPPLGEEAYTLEDALVVGCMLISLLKHAGRVKIACMAQLVNVLAPIMTATGGGSWRQTIFYPLLHASRYGQGASLAVQALSPSYENRQFGSVPLLEAAAAHDEENEALAIFAVNRSQEDALALTGDLRAFPGYEVIEHLVLEHADPSAGNTLELPDEVLPHARGDATGRDGSLHATLPRMSWNVIRLANGDRR
jgi:alpha-N-arabinofuranosidase